MLDMVVIKGVPGTGSQSVNGVKLMIEFLETDFPALGLTHAVEFGGNNGVISPPPLPGEEKADIGGGAPFHFVQELPDG